jgi:hypothetical protein
MPLSIAFLFLAWVSSAERYWVTLAKRRSHLLLEKMAAGESFEQLLAAYPQLAAEDLRACLEYAAALAADEVVLAEA